MIKILILYIIYDLFYLPMKDKFLSNNISIVTGLEDIFWRIYNLYLEGYLRFIFIIIRKSTNSL